MDEARARFDHHFMALSEDGELTRAVSACEAAVLVDPSLASVQEGRPVLEVLDAFLEHPEYDATIPRRLGRRVLPYI